MIGKIKRRPMRDTRASIVSDNREVIETERPHHLNLIAGHRSLGIGVMSRIARRLVAVTITPQVRANDCKAFGKPRRNSMPTDVRLRIAVQQQHSGSTSAVNNVYRRLLGLDPLLREPIKH
ncbi:MAG: hypothetical protein QOJ64_361 [Acidobacteriota bacterium]|nr:hypothetical protein [Acidobacteriota bacterium]